jgi:hypothetical protein
MGHNWIRLVQLPTVACPHGGGGGGGGNNLRRMRVAQAAVVAEAPPAAETPGGGRRGVCPRAGGVRTTETRAAAGTRLQLLLLCRRCGANAVV